jgi:hypothetical protein
MAQQRPLPDHLAQAAQALVALVALKQLQQVRATMEIEVTAPA